MASITVVYCTELYWVEDHVLRSSVVTYLILVGRSRFCRAMVEQWLCISFHVDSCRIITNRRHGRRTCADQDTSLGVLYGALTLYEKWLSWWCHDMVGEFRQHAGMVIDETRKRLGEYIYKVRLWVYSKHLIPCNLVYHMNRSRTVAQLPIPICRTVPPSEELLTFKVDVVYFPYVCHTQLSVVIH